MASAVEAAGEGELGGVVLAYGHDGVALAVDVVVEHHVAACEGHAGVVAHVRELAHVLAGLEQPGLLGRALAVEGRGGDVKEPVLGGATLDGIDGVGVLLVVEAARAAVEGECVATLAVEAVGLQGLPCQLDGGVGEVGLDVVDGLACAEHHGGGAYAGCGGGVVTLQGGIGAGGGVPAVGAEALGQRAGGEGGGVQAPLGARQHAHLVVEPAVGDGEVLGVAGDAAGVGGRLGQHHCRGVGGADDGGLGLADGLGVVAHKAAAHRRLGVAHVAGGVAVGDLGLVGGAYQAADVCRHGGGVGDDRVGEARLQLGVGEGAEEAAHADLVAGGLHHAGVGAAGDDRGGGFGGLLGAVAYEAAGEYLLAGGDDAALGVAVGDVAVAAARDAAGVAEGLHVGAADVDAGHGLGAVTGHGACVVAHCGHHAGVGDGDVGQGSVAVADQGACGVADGVDHGAVHLYVLELAAAGYVAEQTGIVVGVVVDEKVGQRVARAVEGAGEPMLRVADGVNAGSVGAEVDVVGKAEVLARIDGIILVVVAVAGQGAAVRGVVDDVIAQGGQVVGRLDEPGGGLRALSLEVERGSLRELDGLGKGHRSPLVAAQQRVGTGHCPGTPGEFLIARGVGGLDGVEDIDGELDVGAVVALGHVVDEEVAVQGQLRDGLRVDVDAAVGGERQVDVGEGGDHGQAHQAHPGRGDGICEAVADLVGDLSVGDGLCVILECDTPGGDGGVGLRHGGVVEEAHGEVGAGLGALGDEEAEAVVDHDVPLVEVAAQRGGLVVGGGAEVHAAQVHGHALHRVDELGGDGDGAGGVVDVCPDGDVAEAEAGDGHGIGADCGDGGAAVADVRGVVVGHQLAVADDVGLLPGAARGLPHGHRLDGRGWHGACAEWLCGRDTLGRRRGLGSRSLHGRERHSAACGRLRLLRLREAQERQRRHKHHEQ